MTMKCQPVFIIHYHEIALKGRNRDFFERKLIKNIRRSLVIAGRFKVERDYGRILVIPGQEADLNLAQEMLAKVFGLAYFTPGYISHVDLDLGKKIIKPLGEEILPLILENTFSSFKVDVKRSNKEFVLKSPEIERELGGYLKEHLTEDKKVKLKEPELTVYLEITHKYILFYFDKIPGQGGLPAGTGGRAVCLLSSGFDSPVAAWKMAKRGVRVDFIHFHSYPYTNKASQANVKKLVKILNQYQYEGRLFNSAFGKFQKKVVALAPGELRVVLYRRLMLRVAERLAKKLGAKALITGDSLGQVASQTLENIQVISQAVNLPILRPLIGEDKQEIINLADQIGTHQISSQPYEDCCSMFVPQHPETKAKLEEVEAVEKTMEVEKLVTEIFKGIEAVK